MTLGEAAVVSQGLAWVVAWVSVKCMTSALAVMAAATGMPGLEGIVEEASGSSLTLFLGNLAGSSRASSTEAWMQEVKEDQQVWVVMACGLVTAISASVAAVLASAQPTAMARSRFYSVFFAAVGLGFGIMSWLLGRSCLHADKCAYAHKHIHACMH